MNYVQMWLFMTNQSEPLRQTSLLMLLAGGIGLQQGMVDDLGQRLPVSQSLDGKSGGVKGAVVELQIRLIDGCDCRHGVSSLPQGATHGALLSAVRLSSIVLPSSRCQKNWTLRETES